MVERNYFKDEECRNCSKICNNYKKYGCCLKMEEEDKPFVCQDCGKPLIQKRLDKGGNAFFEEVMMLYPDPVTPEVTVKPRFYPQCERCFDFNH